MFVTDCNPGVVAVDQHPALTQLTTVAIRQVNLSGARGLTLLQVPLELDFPITDPRSAKSRLSTNTSSALNELPSPRRLSTVPRDPLEVQSQQGSLQRTPLPPGNDPFPGLRMIQIAFAGTVLELGKVTAQFVDRAGSGFGGVEMGLEKFASLPGERIAHLRDPRLSKSAWTSKCRHR
jgi:hypothetical protein